MLSVFENGDRVANSKNLVHPMRDIKDQLTFGFLTRDQRQQLVDTVGIKGRGRLVVNHNLGFHDGAFGDLNQMLLAYGQAATQAVRGEVNSNVVQYVAGFLQHGRAADHPKTPGFATQEKVFRNSQVFQQRKFLKNSGNPCCAGLVGAVELQRRAVHQYLAGARSMSPGEKFHKRGFPSAIFTCHGMNRSRLPGKTDTGQRVEGAEFLRYVPIFDHDTSTLCSYRKLTGLTQRLKVSISTFSGSVDGIQNASDRSGRYRSSKFSFVIGFGSDSNLAEISLPSKSATVARTIAGPRPGVKTGPALSRPESFQMRRKPLLFSPVIGTSGLPISENTSMQARVISAPENQIPSTGWPEATRFSHICLDLA